MKVCTDCRLQYDDSATVCGQCGKPLQQVPAQFHQLQRPVSAAPTDHTAEFNPQDISDNKVFAMLPYMGMLNIIGIIISLLAAPASPYTMFHVRQGLKIIVVEVLLIVVGSIIPFLGWLALGVGMLILMVVEIICFFRVCKGTAKEAPIVGSFGFLK